MKTARSKVAAGAVANTRCPLCGAVPRDPCLRRRRSEPRDEPHPERVDRFVESMQTPGQRTYPR